MLKVLLTQKVKGLGNKGEVVQVKSGYGHNYLIPMKMGTIASESDIKKNEKDLETNKREVETHAVALDDIKKRIAKKRLSLQCKATEAGTLYAAVTQEEIRDALYETYGVKILEGSIQAGTIKSVGIHPLSIVFKNKGEFRMKIKISPLASHVSRDK
jgi:large subunit ribosomal protein L9